MTRRPRAALQAPVSWRDGVHLTGTQIWCDARRRRDVCFVSSAAPAERVTKAGHGQLIGSTMTLGLLGAADDEGNLGVPLRRRFTLGTLRLELIPSGRGVGATSLFVDIAGRGILYAGPIRKDVPLLTGSYAIEPADVRACDAVVVAAPYADDREFPPIAETIDRVEAWCKAELAAERRPVLLVDTPLDGVEVAACLVARGLQLAGPRKIRDALERVEKTDRETTLVHHDSPTRDTWLAMRAPGKESRVVIWLADERAGLAKAIAKHSHTVAAVSGAVRDAAFAWPYSAARLALLAWIESTGARHVYLTGPGAPKLADAIGPRAHVIGPPQQMTLFPTVLS